MRVFGPLILLVVAIGGFFGLTLMQANAKKSGEDTGGALAFAFSMIAEDFMAAGDDARRVEAVPLAQFIPQRVPGWFRKEFELAEAEAIVGETYRASNVVVSTNNSRLGSLLRASQQADGVVANYIRGERRIIIAISRRTDRDMRSFRGSIMTAISGNIAGVSDWNKNDFGTLHGILIRESARRSEVQASSTSVPLNYRYFTANMGGQVSINILTNAADADLAAILREVDIVGINNTLVNPDPALTPGTGLITRVEGLLATDPPPPTPAYQAFQMLRAGEQLSQTDVRLLQQVEDGKYQTWDELYEEFGLLDQFSDKVLAFYGPKPPETRELRLQRRAIALLRKPNDFWEDHEESILRSIRSGRLQYQEQITRYYEAEKRYGEEILDLLADLPREPTEAEIAAANDAVERQLVIRRGTDTRLSEGLSDECSIQLGVRRCVIGGEDDDG